MYEVDEQDSLFELRSVPLIEQGAPCPILFAEEHALVLSYWISDAPPYHPTKAPIAIVRFNRPYWHQFGPPGKEAIESHPLSSRGLFPCAVFRVDGSSLVRRLARMDSVHPCLKPEIFDKLAHYIFTFHDSTFECVAEGFKSSIEQAGWNEQHAAMIEALKQP